MNINQITSLRRGAIVAALLWAGWMIWWSGSLAPTNIIILSICGFAFGYFWYLAMRFVLAHMRRSPHDGDEGEGRSPPSSMSGQPWPD